MNETAQYCEAAIAAHGRALPIDYRNVNSLEARGMES
jgi:hypothetical protein